MAVGFLLAPFIVHHLGNAAYGVWVLSISSVNYLGLLDLGMRSSVLRFVSREHTRGDHDRASEALSAALWVRVQISVAVLVLSATLAWLFPVIFKIPPDLASTSRISVLIIGVTTSVGMCLGVFGGVVSALNRYDLQTGVTLLQLVVRVSGVVFVLWKGWGLIGIASSEFLAALVGNILLVTVARRIYPQLRVRLHRPQREMLRALWSYSFYVFIQTIAIQLVYQTDNLIVGSFLSASAVTFYAIGNSLCRYTDQFVGSMAMTYVPAASSFDAAGDSGKLQSLYRVGTRAAMAVSLPILVTLLLRGRTFIGLWMGPQYSGPSGTVLILLATALLFSLSNGTAGAIAMGTDRHKFVARWAITEGFINLALSVILVHFMGIAGVALGTLIPSLVIHVIVWPGYIAKLLGLSRLYVMTRIWGVMFLAAAPFALASAAVNHLFVPHSILAFFLQTFALLPIFFATVSVVFRNEVRTWLLPMLRARFGQPRPVKVA